MGNEHYPSGTLARAVARLERRISHLEAQVSDDADLDPSMVQDILDAAHEALRLRPIQGAPTDGTTLSRIKEAKEDWEATVDSLAELICLVDHDGYITRANRAVERWRLAPVEDARGRHLHNLLHPGCWIDDCYFPRFWQKVRARLVDDQSVHVEITDTRLARDLCIQVRSIDPNAKDPRELDARSSAVVVVEDITEQQRIAHELRESETRLRLLDGADALHPVDD